MKAQSRREAKERRALIRELQQRPNNARAIALAEKLKEIEERTDLDAEGKQAAADAAAQSADFFALDHGYKRRKPPDASIRALEKARDLEALRAHDGAPSDDFEVTLTDKEAFELIDWYLTQDLGPKVDPRILAHDVARARTEGDPWIVLQHFELCGFKIVRQRIALVS